MARTQQTAGKSTGAPAPRKSIASAGVVQKKSAAKATPPTETRRSRRSHTTVTSYAEPPLDLNDDSDAEDDTQSGYASSEDGWVDKVDACLSFHESVRAVR
jgi:hypothetical protein